MPGLQSSLFFSLALFLWDGVFCASPPPEHPRTTDPVPLHLEHDKASHKPHTGWEASGRSGGSQKMPSSEEMCHMLPTAELPKSAPSLLCRRGADQMVPFPRQGTAFSHPFCWADNTKSRAFTCEMHVETSASKLPPRGPVLSKRLSLN